MKDVYEERNMWAGAAGTCAADAELARKQRDAALARVAYLQQEYDEAHNVIEAGLERESAALAQVEALLEALRPFAAFPGDYQFPRDPDDYVIERHGTGPVLTVGDWRRARAVVASAALANTPAPAVYTRERVERALRTALGPSLATLDAHPEEVKP